MVQDDERERELVRLFNLNWDPAHQRAGVDATLTVQVGAAKHVVEVEVKSTTGQTVSTARDVGVDHIAKWRRMLFVVGYYSSDARRPELLRCLCLTPIDMAPWIDSIEQKIAVDFAIAQRSSAALTLADLLAICGQADSYTIAQAKTVLRQQRTNDQYLSSADLEIAGQRRYSPTAMLTVLRERARYIAERGATLNNPHLTKQHLSQFHGTDREINGDWAARIRALAAQWLTVSREAT